jgi:hypothetical protein
VRRSLGCARRADVRDVYPKRSRKGIDRRRREIGTVSFKIDAELWMELHQVIVDVAKNAPFNVQVGLQPIGPSAVKVMESSGGNALDIPAVPHVCE